MPKVTKDKDAMIKRGNILYNLRKERDKNQEVVAKHLGISQQAYLKYEHGDSDPTIDALIKLSDFYDVPIDYLLGLSDVQTTFHHEKLEESLKNAYLSLPRNIRADILEAMVDAVQSYQQEESTTTIEQSSNESTNDTEQPTGEAQQVDTAEQEEPAQPTVQEQAIQEVANDTEQIADEAQQVDTVQEETTQQAITQEQPPTERPVIATEIVQKTIVKPEAAARQGEVPYLEDDEYWDMVNDCSPVTKKNEFD